MTKCEMCDPCLHKTTGHNVQSYERHLRRSCDHHNKLDDWSGLKNIARAFTENPPQLGSEARSRFAVNSRSRFMCYE